MAQSKEKTEQERLEAVYKDLPPNTYTVVHGLIVEAARLKVELDRLYKDIKKSGTTEMFSQSEKTEPYKRERPETKIWLSANKNYQAIIKQLNELTPPSKEKSKLDALRDE